MHKSRHFLSSAKKKEKRVWLLYAVLSAIFAALTSILAKVGILGVESNLATAIRTGVVLLMAWIIVFAQGKHRKLKTIQLCIKPNCKLWYRKNWYIFSRYVNYDGSTNYSIHLVTKPNH